MSILAVEAEEKLQGIKATRLASGLTVLSEYMPGLRSATVGIWVRRGARHEPEDLNGICHFIEHCVFKGTQTRTALDIAVESDRLGGHFDAYTSYEMTGFALKVVDRDVPHALDLLVDMLARPRFDREELEREQKVIIEEMKMVEDTPDEYLAEVFNLEFFPAHSLGRPIEGTAQTVSTFTPERTAQFHKQAFHPRNLVIAAAGNIDHSELVRLVERSFASNDFADNLTDNSTNVMRANLSNSLVDDPYSGGDSSAERLKDQHRPETQDFDLPPHVAAPVFIKRKRGLEQAQLIIATPWVAAQDEERFAASLLASVLGGGTSSRLWQRIREERGLAYAVGAGASSFADCGAFQIYAGTSPAQTDEVITLAVEELRRVVREDVGEAELRLVKDQTVASVLLALESSGARAGTLARQEIVHGKFISPDETLRRIEAVTPADMRLVAQKFFTSDTLALGILGDVPKSFRIERSRLEI